ncbi:MAG: hypothetical protein OEW85_05720 [Acidimicrobiia bacterium]|nr:hypothetical protein [Acidimicrobiia bacterium]
MSRAQAEIDGAVRNFLGALDELDCLVDDNLARAEQIKARIGELRERLHNGDPLPQIVAEENRPLLVELITTNLEGLNDVGSTLRRTEAEALRAHGLTTERIAQLFGVTRQRVSTLLRHRSRAC